MVDYRNPSESRAIVRFGNVEISDDVVSCKTHHPVNAPNTAEVVISDKRLLSAKPDYQSEAQVLFRVNGETHVMFTGFVMAVEPQGGETLITMASGLQTMQEQMLGGLAFGGVSGPEMMWALFISSGRDPDVIEIEGYEPGPLEVFEVATALDGITVEEPIELGEVRLLPAGAVSRMAHGQKDLEERYAGGSAWALVLRTARTLLDAETEGLSAIDSALAWLTTRTRYSGVALPSRLTARRFRRDWTFARVSRRDVAFTKGLSTGRWWLRSPQGIAYRPPLSLADVEDLRMLPLHPDPSPQVREALSAWRRAAEETDPLAAVVALWECIEFYVSGISVHDLFTREERRAILRKATEGLQGEQLGKVRNVIGGLNDAPLMVRLKEGLKQDAVPYTQDELALLRNLRNIRNDFVHGRSRELPSEENLRFAKAIVNRMLVHRVDRLCQSSAREAATGFVSEHLQHILAGL